MKSVLTKSGWTARARRIAFGGALGLAVLAAFVPARAQAQDDENDNKTTFWNFDKKLMRDFMRGIGLRDGTEKEIEYRERSPLVIPPSSNNLPPPEQSGAGRTAAWPTDPDVKRRKEAKRKEQNYRGYDPDEASRNLAPSELNPPGSRASTGTNTSTSLGDDGKPVLPSQLGYFGGLFSSFGGKKDEVATFEREPARESLTEPPSGYQTPSAAQPYGITTKKKPTAKKYDPAAGSYE